MKKLISKPVLLLCLIGALIGGHLYGKPYSISDGSSLLKENIEALSDIEVTITYYVRVVKIVIEYVNGIPVSKKVEVCEICATGTITICD